MQPSHPSYIWPPQGRYILAVSGGADSMTLLAILAATAELKNYDLVVAHFDHGMRPESDKDRKLVEQTAIRYGLPFVSEQANLAGASEAEARFARYQWLERVRSEAHASAVITAHHQDDLVETSLLNLARGTGRKGLAPMQTGPVLRPFIGLTRTSIRALAKDRQIVWLEDKTNAEITNPRNFLRHKLLLSVPSSWLTSYLEKLEQLAKLNTKIDQSISSLIAPFRTNDWTYTFPRELVQRLSFLELEEILVAVSHELSPGIELDRRVVAEIALFAKTARPERYRPLRKRLFTGVQKDSIRVYYMGISKEGRR